MNDFRAFPIEKNSKKMPTFQLLKILRHFQKQLQARLFLWPKHLNLYSKYNLTTDEQGIYAIKNVWKCN